MTCHFGGFLTVRHNDIRDSTASLLTEVATEPTLQPLNGETFSYLIKPTQMLRQRQVNRGAGGAKAPGPPTIGAH